MDRIDLLPEGNIESGSTITPFKPRRVASWWSHAEDLLWPEKRVRDLIQRRADALAEAGVDTVIQFGYHFRFDFAWNFGAMHGMFAEIADALHERDIKFLDHYSCNLVARPPTFDQRLAYHTENRHHVNLYPDAIAAETAGYAGHKFVDLREIDLVTGKPAYTPRYQAELFCHNNPEFLTMHAAYLKRLFSEVPLDGIQADDMCIYNSFRSCGCEHCRDRFRREYGHELPRLDDASFWGDTSKEPDDTWGNYNNPAFLDWIQMRFDSVADHLRMVRKVIGEDKFLMTCCSNSAPQKLNAYSLSYEHTIDICDWVMLENCGMGANTVQWSRTEPHAMLQKSIALTKMGKQVPTIAASFTIYEDGAYLGWSVARFWGVSNWICTLQGRLVENPADYREEAELITRYNNWEIENDDSALGKDVVELRICFLKANRENGWRDDEGQEYWDRLRKWSLALLDRNIGYQFVLSANLEEACRDSSNNSPILLDGSAHISDSEIESLIAFVKRGGKLWIVPPLGTNTEKGALRTVTGQDRLCAETDPASIVLIDSKHGANALTDMIADRRFAPRIREVGSNHDWRMRLRQTDGRLTIHILNSNLEGVEHPTVKALGSIISHASKNPLVFEVDLSDMGLKCPAAPVLLSPELSELVPVQMGQVDTDRFRLTVDVSNIRLYGMVRV